MVGQRLRGVTRAGLGLLALNILVLAGCWLVQALASAQEAQEFPPYGVLVDVGGYRLHIYCSGPQISGQASVILESGLGAPGLVWTLVQSEVAKHHRVCSYDRAGYGWSDPGPSPRTAKQFATELHVLLQNMGEKPPYLLASHSFGSLIARVYTSTYPHEVVGLLFIDPRNEDFFSRMPPESLAIDERNFRAAQWLKILTPLGYTRLFGSLGLLPDFKVYLAPLPDEVEAAAWAKMIYSPGHWETSVAERENSVISYAQAGATTLPAELPLIVHTTENGWKAWSTGNETMDEAGRATWFALQEEQSHLTSRGKWQVISNSGHYLYFEQPSIISKAIDRLLAP